MKHIFCLAAVFAALLVFPAGCRSVSNGHLTCTDFANHLVRSGLKVEQIQPVRPDIFTAAEGLAVKIDGKEIGVYKYNMEISGQKRRIERIEKEGFAYVLGIKYPVVTCGAFMLIGVDKNPRKREIVNALETF